MDQRSPERVRAHFDIEKQLAGRLRHSTRAERTNGLYSEVYDQLFQSVPDHPQHTKIQSQKRRDQVAASLKVLEPWIKPDATILELGAGDSVLSLALAQKVKQAIALDVADLVPEDAKATPGFEQVISDGVSIPLPDQSVDVAYSYQLMEHLHVDDAVEQLGGIFRALRPGGIYICNTPSRLTGPHDISGLFGDEPLGFHLKEYTYSNLAPLWQEAGFRQIRALIAVKHGLRLTLPMAAMTIIEPAAGLLPKSTRRSGALQRLLGVHMQAKRPA